MRQCTYDEDVLAVRASLLRKVPPLMTEYAPIPTVPATACVLLDADLNVVPACTAAAWPVAVLEILRTRVREALANGSTSFQVLGAGPHWRIVPLHGRYARCIAVLVDAAESD